MRKIRAVELTASDLGRKVRYVCPDYSLEGRLDSVHHVGVNANMRANPDGSGWRVFETVDQRTHIDILGFGVGPITASADKHHQLWILDEEADK